VAIELTDELVALQRAALAAHAEATASGYSAEGWEPWMQAAERVQAAVTAHAQATGQNRYELEMAVKQAAKG
jgi:phage gp46-like protein